MAERPSIVLQTDEMQTWCARSPFGRECMLRVMSYVSMQRKRGVDEGSLPLFLGLLPTLTHPDKEAKGRNLGSA
jgi:hypothetical protein